MIALDGGGAGHCKDFKDIKGIKDINKSVSFILISLK
jgi:hypothetical protein